MEYAQANHQAMSPQTRNQEVAKHDSNHQSALNEHQYSSIVHPPSSLTLPVSPPPGLFSGHVTSSHRPYTPPSTACSVFPSTSASSPQVPLELSSANVSNSCARFQDRVSSTRDGSGSSITSLKRSTGRSTGRVL